MIVIRYQNSRISQKTRQKQHYIHLKLQTLAHSSISRRSFKSSWPEIEASSVSVSSTSLLKFLSSQGEPWKLQKAENMVKFRHLEKWEKNCYMREKKVSLRKMRKKLIHEKEKWL